ncbi:hypothetical protein BN949_04561 [Agrobacterium tumefaciens]|nr:hypothetical protein RP007_04808 [Rhizobium sp. P007]CDN95389.1 hypothetical protein BN949_04561 [Agrobacterium tumefaciens]
MRERLRAGRIGQAMAIRSTCVIERVLYPNVVIAHARESCEPLPEGSLPARLRLSDRGTVGSVRTEKGEAPDASPSESSGLK